MPPHGGRAYFHFHPDVQVVQRAEGLVWGGVAMTFSGFSRISLQPYAYAAGFNRLLPATRAVVEFEQKLETRVKIHLP